MPNAVWEMAWHNTHRHLYGLCTRLINLFLLVSVSKQTLTRLCWLKNIATKVAQVKINITPGHRWGPTSSRCRTGGGGVLCPEEGSSSSERQQTDKCQPTQSCNYADNLTEMSLSSLRSTQSTLPPRPQGPWPRFSILSHEIIPGLRWPRLRWSARLKNKAGPCSSRQQQRLLKASI